MKAGLSRRSLKWLVSSARGRTRDQARANVIDALRLMLSPEPAEVDDRREREALRQYLKVAGSLSLLSAVITYRPVP